MSTVTPISTESHPSSDESCALHTQPAFIVGAVRSGTTLLRLMLDHHPELAFHFEFEFGVDQVSANGMYPEIDRYHDYLAQHRVFQMSGGKIDPDLDFRHLVNSFLEQKRVRDGKTTVGATVHHHIDRIQFLWPEAKYIHLLRDGRDVARSCMAMGWAGNMHHGVSRWIEAERTWKKLRPQIRRDRWLEVRYEQLIVEPEQTLTEICHFLGVEFDRAIFDYAANSTYERPDARLIYQWRRKLTNSQIQLAESRIAKMLVERGYELSGLPVLEVSPWRKRQLDWQDWYARARFRMRRYGLPLFLVDYFARRLPGESIERWCKEKINRIDDSYVR